MSQRKYSRNGGRRRSTNGQPGQWHSLRCSTGGPGVGGGITTYILEADQYGAAVKPSATDALGPVLFRRASGVWETVGCIALRAQGEDGGGSLFAIDFPGELDAGTQWVLYLPSSWSAVRARDGSPIAGLVAPTLQVTATAAGWIGISNLADAPPQPPNAPTLWVPTDWVIVGSDTVQILTENGDEMAAPGPQPGDFTIDGHQHLTTTYQGSGVYQFVISSTILFPGMTVVATGGMPNWTLSNGSQLGPVRNRTA